MSMVTVMIVVVPAAVKMADLPEAAQKALRDKKGYHHPDLMPGTRGYRGKKIVGILFGSDTGVNEITAELPGAQAIMLGRYDSENPQRDVEGNHLFIWTWETVLAKGNILGYFPDVTDATTGNQRRPTLTEISVGGWAGLPEIK